MTTGWIHHKGKRILLVDFSDCGMETEEVVARQRAVVHIVSQEPPDSVLSLVDVRGTRGTPEIFTVLRDTATQMAPHVRKRAIVGITGAQRILLEIVNSVSGKKTFRAFDDLESAREWLAGG